MRSRTRLARRSSMRVPAPTGSAAIPRLGGPGLEYRSGRQCSITRHGYTSQRALGEELKLNDMIGRVEDAGIARFMSADPTMPDPYSPESDNPYSYVADIPMTYIDTSGYCGVTGENINNLHSNCSPTSASS